MGGLTSNGFSLDHGVSTTGTLTGTLAILLGITAFQSSAHPIPPDVLKLDAASLAVVQSADQDWRISFEVASRSEASVLSTFFAHMTAHAVEQPSALRLHASVHIWEFTEELSDS